MRSFTSTARTAGLKWTERKSNERSIENKSYNSVRRITARMYGVQRARIRRIFVRYTGAERRAPGMAYTWGCYRSRQWGVVTTMDGQTHDVGKWDLLIAHPPCTYLAVSGNRWLNKEKYGEKAVRRWELRNEAAAFFLTFVNADVCKIAIENPVGYMSTYYRKPDCIIQPYEFGHQARKKDLSMAQKSTGPDPDRYCKRRKDPV